MLIAGEGKCQLRVPGLPGPGLLQVVQDGPLLVQVGALVEPERANDAPVLEGHVGGRIDRKAGLRLLEDGVVHALARPGGHRHEALEVGIEPLGGVPAELHRQLPLVHQLLVELLGFDPVLRVHLLEGVDVVLEDRQVRGLLGEGLPEEAGRLGELLPGMPVARERGVAGERVHLGGVAAGLDQVPLALDPELVHRAVVELPVGGEAQAHHGHEDDDEEGNEIPGRRVQPWGKRGVPAAREKQKNRKIRRSARSVGRRHHRCGGRCGLRPGGVRRPASGPDVGPVRQGGHHLREQVPEQVPGALGGDAAVPDVREHHLHLAEVAVPVAEVEALQPDLVRGGVEPAVGHEEVAGGQRLVGLGRLRRP